MHTHKSSAKKQVLGIVLTLVLVAAAGMAIHALDLVAMIRAAHGN